MEATNIPSRFSAMMGKFQAEYKELMHELEGKHQEFLQWMQTSHEEFMQKMMLQIAVAHSENTATTTSWFDWILMWLPQMEATNIPSRFSTMMAKFQAEYKELMHEVEEKYQEFMPWMQASHEEFMQKMMQQIAVALSENTATTTTSLEVNKGYPYASPNTGVNINQHSSIGIENQRKFQEDRRERRADEVPSWDPSRSTNLIGEATGISSYGATPSSNTNLGVIFRPEFGACPRPTFTFPPSPHQGLPTVGQKSSSGGIGLQSPTQLSPSRSTFGETGSAFESQSFGATSTSAFGPTWTTVCGTTTPIFGAITSPAFGAPSSTATGASSIPSFRVDSTPFGQSSTTFVGTSTPTSGCSSIFGTGAQSTTPNFGYSSFGNPFCGRPLGSHMLGSYTSTYEAAPENFISISAMPQYNNKSHEELRWEDHQLGNKGCSNPASQQLEGSNICFQSALSFGRTTPAFGSQFITPTLSRNEGISFERLYGSGMTSYTSTDEADNRLDGNAPGKIISICAMQPYQKKSQDELRWEDYQLGNKGHSNSPSQQHAGSNIFIPFGATSTSALGSTFTQAFGTTYPAYIAMNTLTSLGIPAARASSNPSSGFGSNPAYVQQPAAFGASASESAASPFGSQNSAK